MQYTKLKIYCNTPKPSKLQIYLFARAIDPYMKEHFEKMEKDVLKNQVSDLTTEEEVDSDEMV